VSDGDASAVSSGPLSTRTRAGRPYSRMRSSRTRITHALGIDVPISIARASRLPSSACQPYRAQTKGKTESGVKYVNDQILATAILDRLLHHATTVNIQGDSYRLREKKKAGLLGRKPKPAPELEEEEVGAEA
jgi:hypothetical protein